MRMLVGRGTILNSVARESLTEKVAFKQRAEGREGMGPMDMW